MDTNQNNETLENLNINENSQPMPEAQPEVPVIDAKPAEEVETQSDTSAVDTQPAVEVETQPAAPSEPIKEEQAVSENAESITAETSVEPQEETTSEEQPTVEAAPADNIETQTEDTSGAEALDNYVKAEKKGLKIAILAILLVLDIAALVIYLIGIDKVLSFIK